jgi:hypothetical protein
MRRNFPWFWLFQFLGLALLGLTSLFFPYRVLQFYRGQLMPRQVERPSEALNSWVLGLEELDPPDERVREFFNDHEQAVNQDRQVWSPDDPALSEHTQQDRSPYWRNPETSNLAWENVETWLLSGRPAPPPEQRAAIQQWLHASDQIPQPSAELRRWVANMRGPQAPPKELRLLILQADQVLPDTWRLAAQQVRLASPCILAAAFFTLLGLVTPSIRRPLARVFALVCMFWILAKLDSSLGPREFDWSQGVIHFGTCLGVIMLVRALNTAPRWNAGFTLFLIISFWFVTVVLSALTAELESGSHLLARTNLTVASAIFACAGIFNAWYWLIGKREDPPQDDAGIVQRRPPQLWTLWIVQFFILFFTGILALLFPSQLAELFILEHFDHLTTDIVNDSIKSLGAWIISLALFSFFALSVGRDWVWQGIGVVFCIVFAILAVCTVHIASSGEYSNWIYLYGFQGVVFIPLTIVLLQQKDPYANANVDRVRSEDWCLTDLLIAPFLFWSAAIRGRRPLYGKGGVAATGYLQVLPAAALDSPAVAGVPANNFFVPNRRLPITIRFSNWRTDDDAGLDLRGCALQIGSGETDRLDLLFATGEFSPFSTLIDFQQFLRARNLRKLVTNDQTFREGMAAGARRAPASFATLSYFHQLVLEWGTPQAENYLVRFRIVPQPGPPPTNTVASAAERGIPTDDDLQALWRQDRRAGETRSGDYLRTDLRDRLKQSPVTFRLEAQFHKPQPGDTLDWYDASIEWEFREYPWLPLAELVLETALSDDECERLLFDPSRLPISLHLPRPDRLTDLNDPRALGAARYRIAKMFGKVRAWRNRSSKAASPAPTLIPVASTVPGSRTGVPQ